MSALEEITPQGASVVALRRVDAYSGPRSLPSDVEVEQAVLGAILADNSYLAVASETLRPEHFFDPLHQRMFTCMQALSPNTSISPLTLKSVMKSDPGLKEVGTDYFASLAECAPTLPSVRGLSRIIVEYFTRRQLVLLAEDVGRRAYDGAPMDAVLTQMDDAEAALCSLRSAGLTRKGIVAAPFTWRPAEELPPRDWLYGRHLVRKFASATIAPGGVGKSTLTIAEDLAMVTGRNLLGVPVAGALRVWSLNLEDPADETARRYAAACRRYGLSEGDLGGRLFACSGRDTTCVIARTGQAGALLIKPLKDRIVSEILTNRIDVLRLDPFVSTHSVPENDNGAIDLVVKAWAQVADHAHCAVELVHHSRKVGDSEVTAESARGASALVNACRSVRTINRMTPTEAERFGVETPRRFFRVLSDKQNLAPPAASSDWFEIESIDLGNGPPSDHVGVVVSWTPPNAFDSVAAGTLLAVQHRIATGEWRLNVQSDSWAGIAVAEVLELNLSEPANREKCKALLKTWLKGGAFKVTRRADDNRRDRPFVEVGQWATA